VIDCSSVRSSRGRIRPTSRIVTFRPTLVSAPMPSEAEIREVVRRVVSGMAPEMARDVGPSEAPAPTLDSPQTTTVAIGCDHGGFSLKERIGFRLKEQGYSVLDCGTNSADAVDYPDFALAVAQKVASGEASCGIVIDGAGIGSAMTANKVPGIRAALCYDLSSARNSREHNHANVLTLGAGLIGPALALQITETWLETPWGPGRHANRVEKITAIERQYLRSNS
jgi:ribose 5-phosphate isomerase B